jgi:pimeloyl-ACP methyl ester carboxylesterase
MSDRTSTLTTGQKSPSNPEVGPRLVELLDRCGIAAAHFASRGTADLTGLLSQQPERVASLTLLCPAVLDTRTLARIGERLLIVTGDRGPGARRVQAGLPDLPRATAVVLDDYAGLTWSDKLPFRFRASRRPRYSARSRPSTCAKAATEGGA